VSEAEVVNKVFSTENPKLTPDMVFDRQQSQESAAPAPEAAAQRVIELTAHVQDPQEKLRIAAEYMESQAKRPLPEVERLPVHYDEDGIQGFATALKLRQIIAWQHWLGNTGYTMFDVIRGMQERM